MSSKAKSRTAKKPAAKKQTPHAVGSTLTGPRSAKQKARAAGARDEDEYEEEEAFAGKEESQSQGMSELLGLFQAQFKKRSTQRAKKAESEHEAKLQKLLDEIRQHLSAFEEERDEKVESQKRKLDETWEQQASAMKKFKANHEKVMTGWAASIELLDKHHANAYRARKQLQKDIDDQNKTHSIQTAQQFKSIQKEIQVSKKAVQNMIKESYDTQHMRQALPLLMNS